MSHGTSWEPFTISEDEYAALVDAVQSTPISEIKPYARYAFVALKFDRSLDNIGNGSNDLVRHARSIVSLGMKNSGKPGLCRDPIAKLMS